MRLRVAFLGFQVEGMGRRGVMKNKWLPSLIQLVGFIAGAAIVARLFRYPLDYLFDHLPGWITLPILFFVVAWSVWWMIRDSVRKFLREEIDTALTEALYGDGVVDGFQDKLTRNVVEAMGGDVEAFDERLAERDTEREAARLAEIARKYGVLKK